MVAVVFKKEPTKKRAFDVLVSEMKGAIAKASKPVPITTYAIVGTKENPAARRQIKGSNGKFHSVEFDPLNSQTC